jgi:hypothetical protein
MKAKTYYIGLLVIIMAILLSLSCDTAEASIWDDLKNSTFAGYAVGTGEVSQAFIENVTVYTPEDENLFGVPFKYGRYKVVSFDGKDMVDDILLIGELGESDTFYLSYRRLDEPFDVNAGGILYNVSQHWSDKLPPMIVGLYIEDDGNPLYTFFGEYEIDPGYFVGCDLLLWMESLTNRNAFEGEGYVKHNLDPNGNSYIKAFVTNVVTETYYGIGVGFTF